MRQEDDDKDDRSEGEKDALDRRTFLSRSTSIAMVGGLAAGYGGLAAVAGRYLYPARPQPMAWQFVTDLAGMKVGDALTYRTPSGAAAAIARRGSVGDETDFVALSSTCPHLGCRVHWEPAHNRFFCPCHSGVFDPSGKAIAGPPADAGQSLPRYELRVEAGLLYIRVPIDAVAAADETGTSPTRRG